MRNPFRAIARPIALRVNPFRRALFLAHIAVLGFTAALASAMATAQSDAFILSRPGRTIALQPYGPNILRVTLSTQKPAALAAPGYGIIGAPSSTGWSHTTDSAGYDVYRSSDMVIRITPENLSAPHRLPLDDLNNKLRDVYFGGGPPRQGPFDDTLSVETATGAPLLTMRQWSMYPNQPRPSASHPANAQQDDPGYRIAAVFDSPAGEHYYGLGQHQQGFLDLRDHRIDCWHNYGAIGGETVCVPFMVSSRRYGLIWDNPSKTTVDLGFNLRNTWSSAVGDRVSFFVIAGSSFDNIYEGYRQLTGVAHLLPKPAYGYIQSKAIYPTQSQLMAIAKGYRDRNLPLDVLV
ncbi:MAG TPA: TIM-barrel domain-containing protein, partial [Terracidiphilus sp.]|nr:TIM-barrel domain-containing protein [Terracidiphilus sp.]